MKIFYSLVVLVFLCSIPSQAQIDTAFSITRKNVTAKFNFTKYNKGSVVQNYPAYTIDKSQIHRINMLLRSFVNNESGCDLLLQNYDQLDSIFRMKEIHYAEIIKTQELRSKNYEEAYKSLLSINSQLDQQLKNCRDLAVNEHKKNRNRAGFFGLLAGLSAGLIIGVVVDQ